MPGFDNGEAMIDTSFFVTGLLQREARESFALAEKYEDEAEVEPNMERMIQLAKVSTRLTIYALELMYVEAEDPYLTAVAYSYQAGN